MKTYRVEVRVADYDFSGAVARMLHGGVPQSSRRTIEVVAEDFVVQEGALIFLGAPDGKLVAPAKRVIAPGEWFSVEEVKNG